MDCGRTGLYIIFKIKYDEDVDNIETLKQLWRIAINHSIMTLSYIP